ncbi:MAG: hypothetical protein GX946_00055 [Oligosphaeraceae bacterium]|nr:hypothetical protein [Oligosphaeraceae bacterium]
MSSFITKARFSLFLCCLFLLAWHGLCADVVGTAVSAQRVATIDEFCEQHFESLPPGKGEEVLLEKVTAAFKDKFAAPAKTPLLREDDALMMAQQLMRRRAAEKYPIPEPAEQQRLAEEEFPLYQRGDRVRIIHKKNPFATTVSEGILYEAKNGIIKLANVSIRVRDMLGISGNEAEALKFDEKATQLRRELFIENMLAELSHSQTEWMLANQTAIENEAMQICAERNEAAGHTFVDGRWTSGYEFLERATLLAYNRLNSLQKVAMERALRLAEHSLEAQMQTVELSSKMAPPGSWISPAEELSRRAKAESDRLRAIAATKEAELKRQAEEKARLEAARLEKERLKRERLEAERLEAERARQALQASQVVETPPRSKTPLYAGIAVIVLLIVAGAVYFMRRGSKDEVDFSKFFEGKGRLQKEFWARVDANPDTFKYVAYLFPSMSDANNALSKLTYIDTSKDGNLSSKRQIYFGAYPHQEGAVCFVGGEKLNYALWREASAILPELPGATYFKVSTEPAVRLELPDMTAISEQGELQIKSLGVEDVISELGEFSRCYRYSTESKSTALAFLEKTAVGEEGVIIHVETPEGIFGKDLNGIFEM